MQLANRFIEEDKIRVWVDHQYCAICYSNQMCSLHHILGTISDSILGSIMLCHEHHKEAYGHNVSDTEYQAPLLQYTMRQVLKSGYQLTEDDVEFYRQNTMLYNYNSNE